ncbi:hypothetical protein [Synechococcus phage S-EIVl]|nr:hypothetical protein [Synechococcus phage S-EIVl]
MAYGTVKVDNITFDNGGSDQNVTVSGLYRATTSGVTVSGTIVAATVSGVTIIGSTTVSGATVTGTTANFTSGNFSNIISSAATMSGALIMANQQQVRFREAVGNGVNHIALQAPAIVSADQTITLPDQTGTVVTTGDNGSVTSTMILDGAILNVDINASAGIVDTKLATIATAGKVSNSATTATNANTASAIVARDASGNFTAGTITAALTGAASSNVLKAGDTMTGVLAVTAGTAALPGLAIASDTNTGIYSPGADQLAVSTGGTGRLFIDASGNVGVGTSSPGYALQVKGGGASGTLSLSGGSEVTGGASSILMGNNDSGGVTGPCIIRAANRELLFGVGSSFTASAGGTFTERLRIDSSGNVGIGTSTPAASLDIAGNQLFSAANPQIQFNAGGPIIRLPSGNTLAFLTDSTTERMRIDSAGNVLVGTTNTSPANNNVAGTAINSVVTEISRSAGIALYLNRDTSNGNTAAFNRAGVTVGAISVTTTATAYNTTSDYRLKENITPLDGAIARLNQLPVHRFNFIADPDTVVDGFIAHEAQVVVPECVTGEKDGVDEDGNPIYQGIDQSKLVPLLTAALQEAIARIETLEAAVTALQGA